jgi:hypothetical protein
MLEVAAAVQTNLLAVLAALAAVDKAMGTVQLVSQAPQILVVAAVAVALAMVLILRLVRLVEQV